MPSAKLQKTVNLDILLDESDFNIRFSVMIGIGKCRILFIGKCIQLITYVKTNRTT